VNTALLFRALGDDTRLELLERIARSQPCPLGSISHGLGMTRQGVRRHLDLLEEAGLVQVVHKGREALLSVNPDPISSARGSLQEMEDRWDQKLLALKAFVERGLESEEGRT
jgi:DNA-binding transcriptional ArsR family regulator